MKACNLLHLFSIMLKVVNITVIDLLNLEKGQCLAKYPELATSQITNFSTCHPKSKKQKLLQVAKSGLKQI